MSQGAQQGYLGDDDAVWGEIEKASGALERAYAAWAARPQEPAWDVDGETKARLDTWERVYGYRPRASSAYALMSAISDPKLLRRAKAYLARAAPSIQGAGGSGKLFHAAQSMTRGFAISEREALELLQSEFNPRCVPPWNEWELRRAVRSSSRRGRMAIGSLRDALITKATQVRGR